MPRVKVKGVAASPHQQEAAGAGFGRCWVWVKCPSVLSFVAHGLTVCDEPPRAARVAVRDAVLA